MTSKGRSAKAGTAMDYPEKKRSLYPLRSRAGSRRRHGKDSAATIREIRARRYNQCSRGDSKRSGFHHMLSGDLSSTGCKKNQPKSPS
ncbi:hypothetical protein TNCT_339821 [Trichonephila clavata]|uniref:Uncharacterized protein n=1 Tax=Trichonephila clavata TaxID=2740835 RepID=A0A8X6KRD1_TRICU|nr:hypothetical protein TNCT_339821 [Trichonephila clavata]